MSAGVYTLAGLFLVVGGALSLLAAELAESYHSREFARHVRRLDELETRRAEGELSEAEFEVRVGDELERFHTDRRVDLAIELLFWLQIGGVGALIIGGFVLLAS